MTRLEITYLVPTVWISAPVVQDPRLNILLCERTICKKAAILLVSAKCERAWKRTFGAKLNRKQVDRNGNI